MLPFPLLLFVFLLVPLVELWFMIKVGSWIGAFTTVALVVLTAVIGATLARIQGLATLQRVQATLARGEAPAIEMMEGMLLFVGAVLLLVPGFFTDAIGFVCLFPVTRRPLAWWLVRRTTVVTPAGPRPSAGDSRQRPPRVIEGEFQREDDDQKP